MDRLQLRRSARGAGPYSWSLAIPRHSPPDQPLNPETMNASELMFFFGAPLAHVVQYEDHLKASRNAKSLRLVNRSRRAPEFPSYPPSSATSVEPGVVHEV